MRSGLHDETKDARWPVRCAGIDRLRITPTVEAALIAWKPALSSKHDFIHDAALLGVLTYLLYNGRWQDLYRTLGHLLGVEGPTVPPGVPAAPQGDSRPIPISDGAMRDLAGARKPR